jgi:hypothetical protein
VCVCLCVCVCVYVYTCMDVYICMYARVSFVSVYSCECVSVCVCVCVLCVCVCVCIDTRRCAHTFTQTGTYCSKNPTASHSVDRPQRSAGRAGQSVPATPAVACISESQTGLTAPRARCACGTEDQATHRMSLAAAAASMSDWRRFESPPNERSTMSSF